jgi:hypothetical protein
MNKKKTSRKKGRALSTILLIYLPLHMCKVHVWEGGRIKHIGFHKGRIRSESKERENNTRKATQLA